LIGNKLDVLDQDDVTASEAESFAERPQMNSLETSAKAGDKTGEVYVKGGDSNLEKRIVVDNCAIFL
jgi:hypothetical protein